MMVILHADRLSLLDTLSLTDDSVLGPIIKKLSEDKGDA